MAITRSNMTLDLNMYAFVVTSMVLGVCFAITQKELDFMADTMTIRARIVDNLRYDDKHHVRYFLTNTGSQPYPETDWVLYLDSFRSLEPDYLPYTGTTTLLNQSINVSVIQGQFSSITPIQGFGQIFPNQTKELDLFAEKWSVARYEFLPNWYLGSVTDDLEPRILESTKTLDFVDEFTNARQWKRDNNDEYHPFTPQERFDKVFVKDLGKSAKLVIPTPVRIDVQYNETISVNVSTWVIQAGDELRQVAEYLADKSGYILDTLYTRNTKLIRLSIVNETPHNTADEYTIRTKAGVIEIAGRTSSAVFYGIQTFLSILDSFPDRILPIITIDDYPRYEYRGMHLDVARNFKTVDDVERLIRGMAMYKLNKLHLHLSDDEGWRVQIRGLEELTKVGGMRCHDLSETKCLLPQLGSGPFSNTSGSGFYSIEDYTDILKYAKLNHIEVIPEIDMPGHAHAAIRSMETRSNRLNKTGNESAAKVFRLEDPEDKSKYMSIQEFNDNAMNPCMNSTYEFIEHVVAELIALHKDIQPLKTFHFGGDEVAKGAWIRSPACAQLQNTIPGLTSPAQLKKYFVRRVAEITARHGVNLAGWEDGFIGHDSAPYRRDTLPNEEVMAYSWDNIWEWGLSNRAYRLANNGYKVIMAHATHLYFDHPQEPDPEERGMNWATRYTDTEKVFRFLPDALYENIDTLNSGKAVTQEEICGEHMEKCDPLEKPENIVGIQGQLWTEIVRTSDVMDFMIFPRILALAERAWHKAEWEGLTVTARNEHARQDWEHFANSLGHKELRRLDREGIKYRVTLPGARLTSNGSLEVAVAFPGIRVQYSGNDDIVWKDVIGDINTDGLTQVSLRTRSADGQRFSREVTVTLDRDKSHDGPANKSQSPHQARMTFLSYFIGIRLLIIYLQYNY